MSGWTMRRLQDKADRHAVRTVARHGESHGIEVPLLRKSRTIRGVSQIAQFPQFLIVRLGALLTGGPALPPPTRAKREPRRMKPATIVTATFRHEKGTRHHSSKRRLFYSGKGALATVEESSRSGVVGGRRYFRAVARSGGKLRWGGGIRITSRTRQNRRAQSGQFVKLKANLHHESQRMDRTLMLNQVLAENPNDAFARYGLAMEYVNRGQVERALEEFAKLLSVHPDYTAGYFMAAQALVSDGRREEAKKMLVDGITSARRTGNAHAQSEMTAMLEELKAEG